VTLDTSRLDADVARFRAASPNIAAAFDETKALLNGLDARLEGTPAPPAGAKLRWAPPVLTNPVTIDYPPLGTYAVLDDTKDYIVRPFDLTGAASKTSGRTEGGFKGGRHIVIIGGRLRLPNTNNADDATPLQIQAGDPNGVVHIEGVDIATVNAITVRTGRTVRLQNARLNVSTFQHDHSRVHPDILQVWQNLGAGSPRLQAHHVNAVSDYTGFSCLEPPDPTSGELYDVQLSTVSDGIYPASGNWPHNLCKWTLGNVWFKPAAGKLDDHWGYTDFNSYTMTSADGTRVYTSKAQQVGGSGAATTIGGSQGDRWQCQEVVAGLFGQRVYYGVMPSGDPCAADAGPAYVSPGYA